MKKHDFLDLRQVIISKINENHGFVNTHSHLDRAYTLTKSNFYLTDATLQEKWSLVDAVKKKSSVSDIYDRMAYAVEKMLQQNVQAVGTFIDVDEVVKDKSILAGQKLREKYKNDIKIVFINQALKGVVEKKARKWFDLGSQFVDVIGGLPGKDKGKEAEHLDILFDTAKKTKKMVHVHVDQLNIVQEKETELLVKKTKEHKMKGRVVAVHGVSIAAHPISYRKKLYQQMKEQGIMLISCPSAWIDSRRSEKMTVTHNSIAPIEELVNEKITVGLGTDNIVDIYKPFSDGDMWTELRFLLETCHFYKVDDLVKIATVNGLKILGLK